MPIAVVCQECNKTYRVKDEMAGRRGKCPLGHVLIIPELANNSGPIAPTAPPPTLPKSLSAAKQPDDATPSPLLTLPPQQEGYARVRLITNGITVHERNDLSSPVMAQLAAEDMVNIRRGPFAWTTWYKVILPDGRSGWFNANFDFLFISKVALRNESVPCYSTPDANSPATSVSKQDEPFYFRAFVKKNDKLWVQICNESGHGGYVLGDQIQHLESPSVPRDASLLLASATAIFAGLGGGAITGALAALGDGTLGLAGFLIWLVTMVAIKGIFPRILASVSFAFAAAALLGLLKMIM